MKRHVVLFVVLRDPDLEAMVRAAPESLAALAQAVTAAELRNEQRNLLARLRRVGLDIVEAPHNAVGLALVDRYIQLKLRGRI